MRGEVDPPESVKEFFQILYTGPSGNVSLRKERLVNSTSADVVYLCSGGKRLPGKHISLGVALKSIKGSKSLVNLVNRFGHCISNEKVRRIDIGMESSLTSSNHRVSDRITKTPELYTELAWDNFDVNLETLSGDDSVDHTYGICYQNIL